MSRKNILNVSNSEKERIKKLHKVINEQEIDINVDEPLKGDDTIKNRCVENI